MLRIGRALSFFLSVSTCSFAQQALRLDDHLGAAKIQSSIGTGTAAAAEPILWQGFYSTSDINWQLVRGRIGVRNGDLMLKGEGSTPVMLAPKDPAIDWTLYEAVEIRMSAEAGEQIKIKIGDFEASKKLGPAGQYNIYRFDVNVDAPKGSRLLGVMPTDSLNATVAIHSIRLIPKPANFKDRAGKQFIGKRDEYRRVVYAHSPASITFPVEVPERGRLHVGLGSPLGSGPLTFRTSVDGSEAGPATVVSKTDRWQDVNVDLSRWAGRKVNLQLRSDSAKAGDVALWANPLITSQSKKRPNVLIYTIDTLRPDHSNVYGYARSTTPFLKKLSSTGVVFDDCQAQATWTKSSVASLMTSLYAFTHGIKADADTIPTGAPALAEELRRAGYVTASIVASPFVGRATGLEKGFDYLLEYPVTLRQANEAVDRATDSGPLNGSLFSWLDAHHDEPFFLYAHSTDPHAPYDPPAAFEGLFAKASQRSAFNSAYKGFLTGHQYGGGAVINRAMCQKAGVDPDSFVRQAQDRYDGEIRNNDHNLELLLAKLKQLGILDNTLVIVVSDHGEEFWDHGWTAHGHTVYEELTHAFLLMWNPRLLPAPKHVIETVQLIDVMPTILDLLQIKSPPLVEGESLLALLKGQPFKRRGLVVSSKFAAVRPEGLVAENAVDDFAISDAHWKFIYRNRIGNTDIKRVELYRRDTDRQEQHDVADQHAREVEQFVSALKQWIAAQNNVRQLVGHVGSSKLDQQTIERLRSLGYLGGSSQ